ncbi:DUF2231 domain-containing protein [Desertivirga xinjiangensis]|uniref:DUF2231 domain-containing protein n=1 Tax=Desertivirga xinjiangensis TaxID=539206 RepID=UPI002109B2B5|nr:DUF2231 domain-containing protein [Pedobacter xinjiangensis]
MKSKSHLKGHPIHPILIPFPIAFVTSTLVADAASLFGFLNNLETTARYLQIAGIFSAIAAAIPGLIDYRYTVPPNSSAKKRATKHGLLNTTMLSIFLLAFFLRDEVSLIYIVALESLACILLFVAGWMGGTLVHRNMIGLDLRYAQAGKWKEQYYQQNEGMIEIAEATELKPDQMKLLHIGKKRIVLARTEATYVAFDDRCPHRGGSLAAGVMICGTVQCPWHGSQFDVCSGNLKAGPAKNGIETYSLVEKEDKIYLNLTP